MGNTVLEEVQKIYNDVSEWVKFLEAKHAGLFTFWTALLIGLITSDVFKDMDFLWKVIVLIPILIGSIIDLLSFVPFMNRCKWMKTRCYNKYKNFKDNAVFYCSIFVDTYSEEGDTNKSIEKYRAVLKEYLQQEIEDKLSLDYIKQIIEVSTVGTIKAYLFSVATTYTFCVIIGAIIMLVVA